MFKMKYIVIIAIIMLITMGYVWKSLTSYEEVTTMQNESYKIQVKLQDLSAAKLLQNNTFLVTIQDLNNQPVQHAKVTMFLNMPRMDHGTLEVKLDSIESGIYKGEGIPVMAGDWNADVKVSIGDAPVIEIKHPFEVTR